MIFAYTLDRVLSGKKTQTRRIAGSGERLIERGGVPCVVTAGGRVVYQVGRSYAVQPGRNDKAVARIRLTDIRQEALGTISDDDARAEGYPTRDGFLATWRSIYGEGFDLSRDVWVLTFELADPAA